MDDIFFNSDQVMAFIKKAKEAIEKRIELEETYLKLVSEFSTIDGEKISEQLSYVSENLCTMSMDDQVRLLKAYSDLFTAVDYACKKYDKEED